MQVEASQEVVHLADNGAAGHKATQHFSKVSHGADKVCTKCCWFTISLFTEEDKTVTCHCIIMKHKCNYHSKV